MGNIILRFAPDTFKNQLTLWQGKIRQLSFRVCFTLIFPSYLFSVNSCCCNRNFAFPFLCSLSNALLAMAIALAAIACRNFLNCCTLFIAGASPILLPLPSPALLRSPFPFEMVFVVFLSSCSCHTTYRMEIRLSTLLLRPIHKFNLTRIAKASAPI